MGTKKSRNTSVVVLGAASWLGYLLINKLLLKNNYEISGSLYHNNPDFSSSVDLFYAETQSDYKSHLLKKKPNVIVNFLRGEDLEGLSIHETIIEYCETHDAHYIYASSILALDGYKGLPLTEDLTAESKSKYGKFKATCERLLYDSRINWTILRFASVQGYVPHKKTRNEVFLNKIASNTRVTVDRGVVQNRLLADVLISGVISIIRKKVTGILHFGTTDASEEYQFLKKVALAFGYSKDLVSEGEVRNINLVAIPSKIFTSLGENFRLKEENTIEELLKIPELLEI